MAEKILMKGNEAIAYGAIAAAATDTSDTLSPLSPR